MSSDIENFIISFPISLNDLQTQLRNSHLRRLSEFRQSVKDNALLTDRNMKTMFAKEKQEKGSFHKSTVAEGSLIYNLQVQKEGTSILEVMTFEFGKKKS